MRVRNGSWSEAHMNTMGVFSDGRSSCLPKGASYKNDRKIICIWTGHFNFLSSIYSRWRCRKRKRRRYTKKIEFLLKGQMSIYYLEQKVKYGDELFSVSMQLLILQANYISKEHFFKENWRKKGLPGNFENLLALSEKVVDFKNRKYKFTEGEVLIKYLNGFQSKKIIDNIDEIISFGMKITITKINFEGNLIVRSAIELDLIRVRLFQNPEMVGYTQDL
jgi:hypothetical protein